jgi:hypothetical protein
MKAHYGEAFFLLVYVLLLSVLWILLIHEPSHYLACILQGHPSSIELLRGGVECSEFEGLSLQGMILVNMIPYLIDLAVLLLLIKVQSKFFKVIAYVAFFDLQTSLTFGIIFNVLFNNKDSDPFGLLDVIKNVYPGFGSTFMLGVYLLVFLSFVIFYLGYKTDFTRSNDRHFFRWAFFIALAEFLLWELFIFLIVVLPPLIIKTM